MEWKIEEANKDGYSYNYQNKVDVMPAVFHVITGNRTLYELIDLIRMYEGDAEYLVCTHDSGLVLWCVGDEEYCVLTVPPQWKIEEKNSEGVYYTYQDVVRQESLSEAITKYGELLSELISILATYEAENDVLLCKHSNGLVVWCVEGMNYTIIHTLPKEEEGW